MALRPFLLSLIFSGLFYSKLNAQFSDQRIESSLYQSLGTANYFIDNNKNDSARIYINLVLGKLKERDLLDSSFGLNVQLAKARALEQKHKHSEAIQLFNEIKEKSLAIEEKDLYARTCLELVQLFEKMNREDQSKENLDLAENSISQYQLDSLIPSLFIRKAIWNLTFGKDPDSVRYYSEKALSIAEDDPSASPNFRFSLYQIQGNMVADYDSPKAIEWFKKAVKVAKDLDDPIKMSEAWKSIASTFSNFDKDLDKALAYNDSTIMACYKAIEAGHEQIYNLHYAYWSRSKFFYAVNQMDSAYFYLNKGLLQELAFVKKQQFERVAEVDAKYRDEQKTKQLEDQAKVIKSEQQTKYLLIALFVLSLFFVIGLGYGLINRRKGMLKLAKQNKLIQEQSDKLKSLDIAKSRFFANVSHELRTPLTLVLGPIKSALGSGTLDNRNFTMLTMAKQNAESLLQLVGSILDLSKIEHGKLRLDEKPENLFQLLRRIVSTFESHAQREGLELSFNYKAEEGLHIILDKSKLKNILDNLLSNAIKFTPSGGKIEVLVEDKESAILLVVKDSGRGISLNDLPHVFDRFYQSEEKNAPTEGGTGIGLAYCKELASVMGGKIWVESQLGQGSTFYLELPRNEVLGVQEEVSEKVPDEKTGFEGDVSNLEEFNVVNVNKKEKRNQSLIMVVEDNYSLRDYLVKILESHYQVVTAKNGKEALEILEGNQEVEKNKVCIPSLIISDVMMPVMDGFQLMEKLKGNERFNHLPLMMLTARADMRDRLNALRIGVDDYLLKPFDEEELLIRIENLLNNYSIRMEMASEFRIKENPIISQQDRQWLEAFEAYIIQNLSNEMLNIPEMCRQFMMSESSLLRQLKSLTGLTPGKYLLEMRLDKARQLIEKKSYNSVSQVATVVGYQDARSFSRSFKKRFGKSPSEYMETN